MKRTIAALILTALLGAGVSGCNLNGDCSNQVGPKGNVTTHCN